MIRSTWGKRVNVPLAEVISGMRCCNYCGAERWLGTMVRVNGLPYCDDNCAEQDRKENQE